MDVAPYLNFIIETNKQIRNFLLESNEIPKTKKLDKGFGGSGLIVTDRTDWGFASDIIVITKHYRELSWLIYQLYDSFNEVSDALKFPKEEFFGELGNKAKSFILLNKNTDFEVNDLLLSVLDEADRLAVEFSLRTALR